MPLRLRPPALLLALALLAAVAATAPAVAQPSVYGTIYRPPGTAYDVLETPHFSIIFERGLEEEAREAAAVLEASLPGTQKLVGASGRLRMPVVLNGFNDRANGYVTPVPFKQEIEAIATRADFFSPRYTSWLEQVLPHELTHAVQTDHRGGVGVTWLIRPFAPDAARTLNLLYPGGLTEGLAVYRESQVVPGAGRLNDPLFTMQYRAAVGAGGWSLAQMLERNQYTRPFGRWYVGGALFVDALAERDSLRAFRRIHDLHYRFPFLGHGLELWYGTGLPPWVLGKRVRARVRGAEAERVAALGPLTTPRLVASERGLAHHRPLWLDDGTLLVHAAGYDLRPGFYTYDVATGRRRLVAHQNVTDDEAFSLDAQGRVLFARYVQDPFVPARSVSDLFRLDPASGETERLTSGGRLFAPVDAPGGGLWALQNGGQFNAWVHVEAGPEAPRVEPLTEAPRVLFKRLLPSPDGETTLVLAAIRGHQGLFLAAPGTDGRPTLTPYLLFEDGPIYEASWSADGAYVLFSAAPAGEVANVYALDRARDRIVKLTNVRYGALQPSLSPDGTTLAFVHYAHERYDLATLPFRPDEAELLPREAAAFGADLPWTEWLAASLETPYDDAPTRPYRALRHLAPRMLVPLAEVGDGADGLGGLGDLYGLAIVGADPLQRVAYGAQAYLQNGRLWGEVGVQSARFRLRPALSAYDTPSSLLARTADGGLRAVGREEQGVALGLTLPVTFQRNVFTSAATVGVRTEFESTRIFDLDTRETLTQYRATRALTLHPSVGLTLRAQRNPRDLVPNTGLLVGASLLTDLWSERDANLRRGAFTSAALYLPWLRRANVGLRLSGLAAYQSRGGIYDLDTLLPRGYDLDDADDRFGFLADAGTVLGYGAEATIPLAYPENGLLIVPVTLSAAYVFTFAETLHPADDWGDAQRATALGIGLGLETRFFHLIDATLRVGVAYRVEEGSVRGFGGGTSGLPGL